MAWAIKTYVVVSATPVVVEDPEFASSTSYQPGDVFQRRENNVSVMALLEEGLVAEHPAPAPEGFIVLPGEQGPAGPPGPGSNNTLAQTLGYGNVTGLNDILITGGQKIMGGRACFGASTTATLDGDLSAGDGVRDFSYDGATGKVLVAGQVVSGDALRVNTAVDSRTSIAISNSTTGTAAYTSFYALAGADSISMIATNSLLTPTASLDPDMGIITVNNGMTGGLRLNTEGSAPIELRTANTLRWSVNAGGSLIAVADDTHDIGIAAMNRPRTLFLSRSLDIGSTTGATALGDIKASDGVNELSWDASNGLLTVPNLEVSGTTTTINTEIQTADNYILLNADYTLDTPQPSGLLMNVDPAATSFSISGIAANVITVTAGDPSAVLSATDFILVQDPADPSNAGIYEVLSTTISSITIDTTPVEPFSGNALADDPTTQGTVVGVGLTVWESSSAGSLQGGFGASAPITRAGLVASFDFLNVGSTTTAVSTGDLAAGDGTRELFWDASAGTLSVSGIAAPVSAFDATGNPDGAVQGRVENTNAVGASAYAAWYAFNDASQNVNIICYGSGRVDGNANRARLQTSANSLDLLTLTATAPLRMGVNGAPVWEIDTNINGAHLIATADNLRDIGASGANRPRSGYFGTSLNVGNGITPSTANGDISAGDSNRRLFWDASSLGLSIGYFSGAVTGSAARVARLQGQSWTNDGTPRSVAQIQFWTDGTQSTTRSPGRIKLTTVYDAAADEGSPGSRWEINNEGHLTCPNFRNAGGGGDNTADIGSEDGGTTPLRPRTVYVGTSVVVGNTITITSDAVSGSNLTLNGTTGFMNLGGASGGAAIGDFQTGDGTNLFAYVNSTGRAALDRTTAGASDKPISFIVNTRRTGGSGALTGFGSQMVWQSTTNGTGFQTQGSMEVAWADDTSTNAEMVFRVKDGGGNNVKFTIAGDATTFESGTTVDFTGTTVNGLTFSPSFLNVGATALATVSGDLAAGTGNIQTGSNFFWDQGSGVLRAYRANAGVSIKTALNLVGVQSDGNGGAGMGTGIQFGAQVGAGGLDTIATVQALSRTGNLAGSNYGDIFFTVDQNGSGTQVMRLGNSLTTTGEARVEVPSTGLMVGNVTSTVVGNGDIFAGDGTRDLTWDASTGKLNVGEGYLHVGAAGGAATRGTASALGELTVGDANSGLYFNPNGQLQIEARDTNTTGTFYPLTLLHTLSSGTAAVGMGVGITSEMPDAVGQFTSTGRLRWLWSNPANGAETTNFQLELPSSGTLNTLALRVRGADQVTEVLGGLEVTGLVTGAAREIIAHTAGTTLTAAQSGSLNTNRGAAGIVTLILPVTTSLQVGTNYTFRRLASFAFRVDPQAADNLRYSAGAMAAGEYLEMGSDEATFRVTWDGSEWLVDLESGTLNEETP